MAESKGQAPEADGSVCLWVPSSSQEGTATHKPPSDLSEGPSKTVSMGLMHWLSNAHTFR